MAGGEDTQIPVPRPPSDSRLLLALMAPDKRAVGGLLVKDYANNFTAFHSSVLLAGVVFV